MTVARGLALALLALLAGCGSGEPPRWIELARGFEPQPVPALVEGWQRAAGAGPATTRVEGATVFVSAGLPTAAWTAGATPGSWTTELPRGALQHGLPGLFQLRAAHQGALLLGPEGVPRPGTFRVAAGRVELFLPPEAKPADDLVLTARLEPGRLPADGVWQVRLGPECGAGIPVWDGCREELQLDVPGKSRLVFQARYQSLDDGPVTLRVRLDGETLGEIQANASELRSPRPWTSLALPVRGAARIAFEAEGPPGQALFLHPVIGPVECGGRGERPWNETRPDIVLLLADTFRADGLAAFGGPPELTPALNHLATESLRFQSAHSAAAWTLPSISSLLTGLAPGQHTANDSEHALPGDLTTIAEALAAAGYRTGAVTDSAYFAPTYGLDQGFETFVMNPSSSWDVDWNVARAREFLEHDDGRPIFLLVHSYRTHLPYRVGPEEDLAPWNELLASGCALLNQRGKIPREEWVQRLDGCRERYQDLYRAGVRDLDRAYGELLADLDGERFREHGFVLFTSDHGEALGENDDLFHDGDLWETKLRVPLLLSGPGLVPADVRQAVSLLDVAPTLASLARLAVGTPWPGQSLLTVSTERPVCAFLLKKQRQIAVLEDGKKLIAPDLEALERGAFEAAYDLRTDPGEEQPVEGAEWPAELAHRRAGLVRALLTPASQGGEVILDHGQRKELERLGYGGEGDDE